MTARWLGVAALALVISACASDEDGNGGSGGSGGSGASGGSTGGTTSSGTGGGPSGPVCPPGEPSDGADCATDHLGLSCEYDQGPIVTCRGMYSCTSGQWSLLAPGCSSVVGSPPDCPADPPSGSCPSPDAQELCIYADGTHCGCSNCLGGPCGGPAEWVCGTPPGGDCPATAPNFGQACSQEGAECTYGACALGTQAQRNCMGGIWLNFGVPCPE